MEQGRKGIIGKNAVQPATTNLGCGCNKIWDE